MEEHFIRVGRTARYHLIGDPSSAKELWIVAHGYGQLARYFLNNFSGLEVGRCIVAPEGLNRFYTDKAHTRVGATWMTREDRMHEIADHVAYLDELVHLLLPQCMPGATLHAFGYSQGVATVTRWSLKSVHHLQRLVLWAGNLPPDLDKEQFAVWRALHVDLVRGDSDAIVGEEVMLAAGNRLLAAKVPHTLHHFHGGHELEALTLGRLFGQ